MVPGRSIQIRFELVGEGTSRCNRALVHRWHTIHPRRIFVKNPMPVECCAFFWPCYLVINRDLKGVAPVRFYSWSRKLSINQYHTLLIPIRWDNSSFDREYVISYNSGVGSVSVGIVAGCSEIAPGKSSRQRVICKKFWEQRRLKSAPCWQTVKSIRMWFFVFLNLGPASRMENLTHWFVVVSDWELFQEHQ